MRGGPARRSDALLVAGSVEHPRRGQEELAALLGLGLQRDRPAAGRVDARKRPAGEPAATQIGGGLVGVAGDAVEQYPVRLRRRQSVASAGPAPRARSRSTARRSNTIKPASAKRSAAATAA